VIEDPEHAKSTEHPASTGDLKGTEDAAAVGLGWHRLHPLSPVINAGRPLSGVLGIFALSLVTADGYKAYIYQLVVAAGLVVTGFVRWLVTRWKLDGATLRIETGLLRRDSQQLPMTRIQAVDVVRPFLARVLGLAALRIRLAGAGKAGGRLAYLTVGEAARLRATLLAGQQGTAELPLPRRRA
jgi:putative membrane protein